MILLYVKCVVLTGSRMQWKPCSDSGNLWKIIILKNRLCAVPVTHAPSEDIIVFHIRPDDDRDDG